MRTGNLAEPVVKRSVFRQLNMEISGIRGHYGADCVPLCNDRAADCAVCDRNAEDTGKVPVISTVGPVPGSEYDLGRQVTEAVNRLAAGGAVPCSLTVQAVLPTSHEEADLRTEMKQIRTAAERYEMEIADVQIHTAAGVVTPQYFVTAVGMLKRFSDVDCKKAMKACKADGMAQQPESEAVQMTGSADASWQPLLRPGQELVVTKWIALAGTASLAQTYEKELHTRYPFSLIDHAKEFETLICAEEEARAISHFGACAVHHLSQGGIFNALWEMADRAGVGLEVDLKKIPVKQETIEICEYFDINPYYLYSAGAFLVGTDRAEALIAQLASIGVPAAVIGRATDGNDRVIRNGEDCRFLDRPKQDEWYRRIGQ